MVGLLDDLMKTEKTVEAKATAPPRAQSKPKTTTVVQGDSAAEVREAHVKAAVFPSEKPVFEHLAKVVHGKTMSDFLRDYLINELNKARDDGRMD